MADESRHVAPSRTALVTGGSRGIGEAVATGLAAAGLDVAVLGRTADRLEQVADRLRGLGVRAVAVTADVTDPEQVTAAARRAEADVGPVDLLVNAAGVIEPTEQPVWEEDPSVWRAVVEADLLGPMHAVRAVVPGMVARGAGRVVDISSGAGLAPRPEYTAYSASKAGLFRLSGHLHVAGYASGLRAFEISPGVVATEMTAAMAVHADRTEWTPVGAVVELVVAAAQGRLDAWSGRFVRAGADTVDSLVAVADRGLGERARTLVLEGYGPDDPLG